jgi:hypothetical protein
VLLGRWCSAAGAVPTRLALLAPLGACTPPEADTSGTAAASAPDTASDLTPAELTAAMAARLSTAISLGLPEPALLRSTFEAMFAWGDGACPPSATGIANPDGGCQSASGATFAGVGELRTEESGDPEGDHARSYAVEQASFVFANPAGERFVGGGGFGLSELWAGGDELWFAYVSGSWAFAPDPGWLGAGSSGELQWSGGADADGGRLLSLSGSLGVAGAWVYFDSLEWRPDACEEGPAYAAMVRDDEGRWFDLVSGACEPCAQLGRDGVVLGEVCVDLAPALQAGVAAMGVAW